MPFVRGGELFEHLQEEECFSEDRARYISLQIAIGLGHLHSKNIVYRDLKPENVLIGEDGYATIIDFGISKKIAPSTRTFSFCGTPEYFAPELIKQKGHDFQLDWWTLGVLTYEVIVGHPPFATGDDGDLNYNKLIKKICETQVAFPNLEMHDIAMSKECKDFIYKCLKKDPAERLGAKNGL